MQRFLPLCLLLLGAGCATTRAISGTVTNHTGEPLDRAIVRLEPGGVELVTDRQGRFYIDYLRDDEDERVKLNKRQDYVLRGIVVIVKDRTSGTVIHRGWIARKLIEIRRAESDSFKCAESKGGWAIDKSTWHKWPVEMSMKTALHYAISRGWAVIDDTEAVRALSADVAGDVSDPYTIDVDPEAAEQSADQALGLLSDDSELDGIDEHQTSTGERVTLDAEAEA